LTILSLICKLFWQRSTQHTDKSNENIIGRNRASVNPDARSDVVYTRCDSKIAGEREKEREREREREKEREREVSASRAAAVINVPLASYLACRFEPAAAA
jgi:hypothetical protein